MLDIALEQYCIIWRLITDYYNLYTIQLTAWTDAYGFDSRVSAKTQTTQTMRYNHRVKKMVKIKSLMFRIWLCDYTIERIDNALREMDELESGDTVRTDINPL